MKTPSNPIIETVDLKALACIAHEVHALVEIDITGGTPLVQRKIGLLLPNPHT